MTLPADRVQTLEGRDVEPAFALAPQLQALDLHFVSDVRVDPELAAPQQSVRERAERVCTGGVWFVPVGERRGGCRACGGPLELPTAGRPIPDGGT